MTKLLPIGHKFWTSWQFDWASTEMVERRYLYLVVAHRNVSRFVGDDVGEVVAETRCMQVEERMADMSVYASKE